MYKEDTAEIMPSGTGETTPTTAGKQMSSKLREKLKRCGRYHCSPTSAKRPHVTESPHTLRADNLATTSPVSKVTQVTPVRTPGLKGKCSVDTKGGKRLFEGCSSGDNLLQTSNSTDVNLKSSEKTSLIFHKPSEPHDNTCSLVCDKMKVNQQMCSMDKDQFDGNPGHQTSDSLSVPRSLGFDSPQAGSSGPDRETESESALQLQTLNDAHTALQQTIHEKRETLRKLKMVKMYRTKNNLDHLEGLISTWRTVSQQALQDLHDKLPEPKPTLTELVNHLQIDHSLVQFDPDEESFG